MWGDGKMFKKLLTFVTIFCLMLASVSALVRYTGPPQLPYLVFGTVEVNGNPGNNVQLTILNQGTTFTKTVTANSDGYWQEDVGNWLTNFAGRPPVQFGDNIVITAVNSCGTGDTCQKSFLAYTPGYDDWAKIDFSLTGTIPTPPPPPTPAPSSGGGGSSGGGSSDSGRGSGVRWDCEDWSVCKDGKQSRKCKDKTSTATSTSTQSCIESKPTPTPTSTPDTPEPKEPVVTPTPTPTPEPTTPVESPVEPDDPNELRDMLLRLIAAVIGVFAWGAGFRALIIHYLNKAKEADKAGDKVLAAKHRARSEKMAKTVVLNFLAGKYKKK